MFKRLCVAVLALCVGYGADLLQQCNSGDDKACKKLGQQCEGGDVSACGKLFFYAHYRLCNDGDGAICESLAYKYAKIKNYTKAREYFQKACDLGEQSSCDRAKALKAGEYLALNGIQNDEEFMKQLEQKMQECDNGNTKICQSILMFIEPICNTNAHKLSCYVMGVVYTSKNRDVQNYHKAKEYFQKACKLNDVGGCYNLGVLYEQGQGVHVDYKKSIEYYQKACDLNHASACSNVGNLYNDGQGIRQDHKKAREYLQKACDMEDTVGCYNLGVSYALGRGVRQNLSNAMEYFGKACDYGLQQGCDNYKMIRGKLNIR